MSTRWEREMAEYKANRRMPRPVSPLDFFHTIFCCCATRIGGMFSLIERADGTPILIVGPCWPCCSFVTVPLILGIAGLVSYYVLFNEDINMPVWVAGVYLPVVAITICSLSCVSCRDPGLLERVTDEEAGHGGWFWNEQVGSFRPTGAMYSRECKVWQSCKKDNTFLLLKKDVILFRNIILTLNFFVSGSYRRFRSSLSLDWDRHWTQKHVGFQNLYNMCERVMLL